MQNGDAMKPLKTFGQRFFILTWQEKLAVFGSL
jgi:hypothetical protein